MLKVVKGFENANSNGMRFMGRMRLDMKTRNYEEMVEDLKKTGDHRLLNVDMSKTGGFDWRSYYQDYFLGLRKYVMKEDLEDPGRNRKKLRTFHLADVGVKSLPLALGLLAILRMC